MMMRAVTFLAIGLVLATHAGVARADALPADSAALEKRLAAHDPRAVAAARHYYATPAIRDGLVAMIDNVNKAMAGLIAKQNANLTPEQSARVQKVVGDALKERLDLLTQMNMAVALDTFSTDELVALDKFYSSPEGASVLAKMPKLMAQIPGMMQTIMPDYMNEVRAKLKASDPELKL